MTLYEIIDSAPVDSIIGDNLVIAYSKINNPNYRNIVVSVSGGADSDIVVDIVSKCDNEKKAIYVWFDTGLEYQATKEHIRYLENRYGILIERYSPKKPIPTCCKEYGQPFMSKQISEFSQRLQKYNFQWEDEPFEILIERYPKCKSALRWWCNAKGDGSKFNISEKLYLKEFMTEFPPQFRISNKCCHFAKKLVSQEVKRVYHCDLSITGIRKAEGGVRASAYKSCFSCNDGEADEYRPIFWYTKEQKERYSKHYGIQNSKCYTDYGLDRTGCAGCPFGKFYEHELYAIEKYEPKLLTAVNNIFKDSYEYTRLYKAFVDMKRMEEKESGT